MKKEDFKNGMKFITRNEKNYYVIGSEIFVKKDDNGCMLKYLDLCDLFFGKYTNDLQDKDGEVDRDIMKVFDIYENLIYERKDVDEFWSKIPVDTKLLVKDKENGKWIPRHFAEYKGGKVLTYPYGLDSWTSSYENPLIFHSWKYCKIVGDFKEKLTIEQSKELREEFEKMCEKDNPNTCEKCKYEFSESCEFSWMFDNYDITKK